MFYIKKPFHVLYWLYIGGFVFTLLVPLLVAIILAVLGVL